ncbi:MAG: GntR family transcriptional regulator [Spirochaetaceae bacterium]
MKLDSNNPVPLYFQLQEIIKRKIEEGEYQPGDLIPTEKELQELYGISRITVRNAINGLVLEDLLVKRQGYGTVVASKRMVEDFSKLSSFTEKMRSQGAEVTSKVLEVARMQAPSRIAEHMRIETGDPVIEVKRLRFVDGEPIAFFTNYLLPRYGVNENDDYSGSIYELLEKKYGVSIVSGEKVIEAMVAASTEAKLLNIAVGDPVLLIRNVTCDENGEPVDYAEGIYRADRYKYVVKLKR